MNITRILICVVALLATTSSYSIAQDTPPECETLGFCPRTITNNARGARSVFATDVDGDGDIDVLSASERDTRIRWYENIDGLGTYRLGQSIITDTQRYSPLSIFAADLDSDGDEDILMASNFEDLIAWYENIDGLGHYGQQQVITVSADGASSVFAKDLDGDGDIDVLSASFNDDKIAWYENTDGLGNFGPQQIITTSADRATSVFAVDLDSDGDNDVLSASRGDDKIAWYENVDGLGTFGFQQVITTTAETAWSVFAIDLDSDGDNDVLSASRGDAKIAWYENTDGLGAFGPQQVITENAIDAWSVFAVDMDGDGDIDVLSASLTDNKIAWYENTDGLGTFGFQQIITTDIVGAISVFAADLDNDGDSDVISASVSDGKIAWYENVCEEDCNANGIADECEDDVDSDGLIDECDTCPESIINETIIIKGCDTGVLNNMSDDGCTMADVIAKCQSGLQRVGIGKNVSCVANIANDWLRNRLITGREYSQIIRCCTKANKINRNTLTNIKPQQP